MVLNSAAKAVRLNKEKHPERYCPVKSCLWSTIDGGRCATHTPAKKVSSEEFTADILSFAFGKKVTIQEPNPRLTADSTTFKGPRC